MRTLTHILRHDSRSDDFTLYPLFDIHLGAAACDEALLVKTVEEVRANPRAYVILGGDNLNSITRDDPRANEYERADWLIGEEDTAGLERDQLVKLLYPIADRILAVLEGNHEAAVLRHDKRNIYWELVAKLADAAGRKPEDIGLGYEGFIRLRFLRTGTSSKVLTIYAHHGWGGGRKAGGKVNKLDDFMGSYDADLYLMGHVHDIAHHVRTTVSPGNGKRRDYELRERHGLICGTLLRPYVSRARNGMPRNSYGQVKGYAPSPVGYPVIRVKPWHSSMEIVIPGGVG